MKPHTAKALTEVGVAIAIYYFTGISDAQLLLALARCWVEARIGTVPAA